MTSQFKVKYTFEDRKKEADKILSKYPDRIPIILEQHGKSMIKDIDRNKFLVPNDITLGQFIFIIRKRLELSPEKAIFLFVNNTLPTSSDIIGELYNKNMDEDGFLYMVYSGENTFG